MITIGIAIFCSYAFPLFRAANPQKKSIILRSRYWLYYALVFMSGARRQIFIVFAGFLMVEKFGYSVGQITFLFLLNAIFNIWLAPLIGRLIAFVGERAALVMEYIGLIIVFTPMPLSIAPCWRRSSIWLTISSLPWRLPSRRISRKLPILRISPARQACRLPSTTLLRVPACGLRSALAGLTTGGISFGRGDGVHLIAAGVQCPRHPEAGNEVVIGHRGQVMGLQNKMVDASADVLVIGAGVVGLATARRRWLSKVGRSS